MSMLSAQRRGTRRPRRRRALMRAVGVLLAFALLGGIGWAGWWYGLREEPAVATSSPCPTAAKPRARPAAPVRPLAPERVLLNVYNATGRTGLAGEVAEQLRERGFTVRDVANDPTKRRLTGAAELRHGRAGGPARVTIAAHVGPVPAVADRRKDTSVDLVLGPKYRGLRTKQEAAVAIRQAAAPAPRATACR